MTNRLQNEPWWPWHENRRFMNGPWPLWDKYRQITDAIWWGGVLIWAGLVFIADSTGLLPLIGGATAWSWVFLGAGGLALAVNIWRLASPDVAPPLVWDYIWITIFLMLGLGGFANFVIFWPLIIVMIGLIIVISAVLRRE